MASNLPAITTAALIPGYTSIDQKTISLWFQLTVGAGVYETGGIPAGFAALANSLTVDENAFLEANVVSELATPSTGTSYKYRYIPAQDYLQIFAVITSGGAITSTTELGSSVVIPAGVLNDVIVAKSTYNRL